jgi:hypothetical protein
MAMISLAFGRYAAKLFVSPALKECGILAL